MRRLLTFAACLLIMSVPVCAQRGGGGHGGSSGGSHGGFGGGHAISGGGHSSFGGGGFGGHAGFVGHGSGGPGFGGSHIASRPGSSFGSHFGRGDRFHGGRGEHFRNGRFGFRGYGYPYYGYPYYGYPLYAYGGIDPYWWWDTYSNDQDDADQRAMANEMNAENLDEQQRLREQDQDAYARPMARPRDTQARDEHARNDPATVLIFRDQHQREIQNYAIVDGLLWNFTPQRIEKIPLAILDIPATIKANEDRGVEFSLPRSSEGQ